MPQIASPQIEVPKFALTASQGDLLELASQGGTTESVATEMAIDTDRVEGIRDDVIDILGARNMANAVFVAIRHGVLPIEIRDRSQHVRLNDRQLQGLGYISAGYTNREIAERMGMNCGTFISNVYKAGVRKIGASGRTHSVRRTRELGVLRTDSSLYVAGK